MLSLSARDILRDNMSRTKRIVLASASPRRRELLALTGLEFTVDAGEYQEEMDGRLVPHELARHLSRKKAEAVSGKYRNAVIISADTFIVYKGDFLGKPRNRREAKTMLMKLNGKSHSVVTGFTILDTGIRKKISRSVETKVNFRKLTVKEIEAYVKSGEPLGKAGAYAIQGLGSIIIKKIEGDYFNVIGLPLSALAEELKKFGINIL